MCYSASIMNALSYLIDGSSISQSDIKEISRQLKQSDGQVEVLLYNIPLAQNTPTTPTNRIKFFDSSSTTAIPNIRRAIASASGNLLIYTSLPHFINHNKKITSQLYKQSIGNAILPVAQNLLHTRLGIRHLKAIPYVAFTKNFLCENISNSANLRTLISIANKQLSLKFIQQAYSDQNHPIIVSHFLVTPYTSIAKKQARLIVNRYRAMRSAKIAEKLRRNVPDVYFDKDIPVFIICRDRVEPLRKLVSWLEEEGLKNIIFIDNASTYPPLLKYLKETSYETVMLNKNAGHTAPWSEGAVNIYAKDRPFIVTDPDVIPDDNSHGAVKKFCELLTKYPERTKVGFGLKIDDIPEHYELKSHVVSWESQFWESTVEPEVYDAEIDTTFAVYRQNTPYTLGPGLRTGGKYVARHEPWYINSKKPSEEVLYYRNHASKDIGSWGITPDEGSELYNRHNSKKILS